MQCWARYLFIAVVVILGLSSMLGACGQKGPLYLPQPAATEPLAPHADVPDAPAMRAPTDQP